MKCWLLLGTIAVAAVLTACGNTAAVGTEAVRTVPTSPNAAYQTAFPLPGATNATILEGRLPGSDGGADAAEDPTPDAAPVVTAGVYEEETVSPVTIPLEQSTATTTP